jgi:hypothetical protein
MSPPRRGSGDSIGPKVLIAAVVIVACVIGISGIYPQVIDAEWVRDTGTRLPVMSLSSPDLRRTRALGAAAPTEPLSRRTTTTGQGMVSPPHRTSTRDTRQPQLATAEAVAPTPEAAAPPAVSDVPLPAEAAPAPTTKIAEKPKPTGVAEKPKPVAKKVRVAHRRSFHGTYAQYNGWSWPGGGWGGGYRF